MGRVPRWRMGDGVYHVYNRGINKSWVLSDAGERQEFLSGPRGRFNAINLRRISFM